MEKLEKALKTARNLAKFEETLASAGYFLDEEQASTHKLLRNRHFLRKSGVF